ncbi:T9SS type A sorting domain-containing protein [Winogradskyella helgolandensis]|uniref:T9SS type A sorting domain-containing protein n=1 Tax=Winogradskyella helgolandensis TaxID=2697010 RepID=UPI0015BD610F|nr:choice-of-anchor tandem repeat GloVer-containing protein [Winogradskyella helgolandensis]
MNLKLHFILFILLSFQLSEAQTPALYGVSKGESDNLGLIFKTDINGENLTVIHNLKNDEGKNPSNSSLCEVNGKLYGTTEKGGVNDMGVLYEYDLATQRYSKLHDFDGENTGETPYSNVILASNGKLYGTTLYGGVNDLGTLFEYDIVTNTLTKKLEFDGANMGRNVYANVIQAANGKLYGLTNKGGANDAGVLYEYDYITETFINLFDFESVNSGFSPNILVEVEDNILYGTSGGGINGAGTIFKYDISTSTFTKKIDFEFVPNGGSPSLSLMLASNGNLYGLTKYGGVNNDGVLYEYNIITETFTKKFDFYMETGSSPYGGLLEALNGKLYGLTHLGGVNNKGVLFEFDLATDVYTKKLDFDTSTGEYPNGRFMQASNGKLYATARYGGASNSGVLFEYDTEADNFEKKIDFNNANMGSVFRAGFAKGLNDKLYLISSGGGKYNYGTLLEFDPVTNFLVKKYDFSLNDAPQGAVDASVIYATNDKIYGVSSFIEGNEVLFEFDLQTNTYTTKVSFDNPVLGTSPTELIEASNGKIYGMTSSGGVNDKGVIFEYDYVSHTYSKLFDFGGINGGSPAHALFQAANGKLYGMTGDGGVNNKGTLFEFDSSTNTFTKRFDFSIANPGNASASFVEFDTDLLYAFTREGGVNSAGVVFEYNLSTDTYIKTHDFETTSEGSYSPQFRFLKTSENKLLGLSNSGGTGSQGTLFEYNPNTNMFTTNLEFNDVSGQNPIGALVEFSTSPLSIPENTSLNSISLYPNPVKDKLMISMKNSEAFQITISNVLGKQVFAKPNVTINEPIELSHLQSGLYILKAISNNGSTETIKFIKN